MQRSGLTRDINDGLEGNMQKKRLLKLADLLEADAKNKKGARFGMGSWGYVNDPKKPVSCGTQACAMGLAALSGAFKRAGLEAFIRSRGSIGFRLNGKRTSDGYHAAMKIFDLSPAEAQELFTPTGSSFDEGAEGERAKARQIRQFVKTGVLPESL